MKPQVNNVYWYTDIHINIICCNNKILSEIEININVKGCNNKI